MPIIVSYEDLQALGSTAFQAGFEPGYANSFQQSRESALNRRHSDTQMLMNQAFNRQNMAAQQGYDRQRQERAYSQQSEQDRQGREFQAQMLREREGFQQQEALNKYALNQQESERDRQFRMEFEGYQQGLQGQRNMEMLDARWMQERRQQEQERSDFIARGISARIYNSPEEAGQAYDAAAVQRETASGAFARRGGTGSGAGKDALGTMLGTLSGENVQGAILALQNGRGTDYLSAVEKASIGRDRPLKRREAIDAMLAYARAVPIQQVGMMAAVETDPELKERLGLLFRDATAYGANQPPQMPRPVNPVAPGGVSGGPGPGLGGGIGPQTPDLSGMSDEELMRLYQQLQSQPR